MKKLLFSSFFLLLHFIMVNGQAPQSVQSDKNLTKAEYLEGDLTQILYKRIQYPMEALKANIFGDVIINLTVLENGKLDSINIVSSPSPTLSDISIASFDQLKDSWSPCTVDGKAVNRSYFVIFQYRITATGNSDNYKSKADKFFKKEKHKKALNAYNLAIEDSQYQYELFESRSKIKKILGDNSGSKKDYDQSVFLKNKVMTMVEITGKRIVIRTITGKVATMNGRPGYQ